VILHRYRVVRPLMIHGRIAATGEVIRLPEYAAAEYIESGHLKALEDAVLLVNGDGSKWTQPMTRSS
jgi:hypothetical protein